MLAAYPQRTPATTTTTTSTTSNPFNRYPSSLSSACALQPRPTSHVSEDEDESSESVSGSSQEDEDDGEMMLDTVIHNPTYEQQQEQAVAPPPRLHIAPTCEYPTSAALPPRSSHQPAFTSGSRPQAAAPIIVTYGPFHSPDVDVAVAYGQMVCYLWFWSPSNSNATAFDPAQSALQLQPHPHFIHFLSKVITQTQLSKTVLVLALHYLWLLKRPVMQGSDDNADAEGAEDMGPVNRPSALATAPGDGSHYIVSVIALMLANKFMDDNTYTNKSWAAICGVTLEKINSMEREFLIAINHALHVDVNRFMSWIRIMQSFFMQRQSRFDSRSRRIVRLPHHHHQPYSHQAAVAAAPQHSHSHNQYYRQRAHSRPRLNAHSDDGHGGHQSDVSLHNSSSGNGNAAYGRARSVSPKVFQFTFVPPINTQQGQGQISDNTLNVPTSSHVHHPISGTITTTSRHVSDELHQRPFAGERPRPYTGHGHAGSYATLYRDEMEVYPGQPSNNYPSSSAAASSSRAAAAAQWPNIDTSQSQSSGNAMIEPSPILVTVPSSRSKRSASQAFSPRSAEPPRPRPDERDHSYHSVRERDWERQSQHTTPAHQTLVHPHPVRKVRPQFVGWHQHSNVYPLAPHHSQPHSSSSSHQYPHHPQLTSYPNNATTSGSHHHSSHPVRRMNQVHEILASRPSTAVEAGFARMSLSSSQSHGPSPVSDTGPSRPVHHHHHHHQQQQPQFYSQGSHPRSQLSLHNSHSQLVAPFDPYTAPTFRNEGAREDEPLRLQFYQLVQGGRGVLRCQPVVNVGMQVPSQGEVVYSEGIDVSPQERGAGAGGSQVSAGGAVYPPSLAFSTPTEDDEGMSSSDSSNGTGWEYHHHQQAQSQSQSHLQPHRAPPSARSQPQVVGGGYSLPPLSTLLAETQQQFASPIAPSQLSAHTPLHENVKYAEFANAGPPASYVPQWGFFSNSPGSSSQYGRTTDGSGLAPLDLSARGHQEYGRPSNGFAYPPGARVKYRVR